MKKILILGSGAGGTMVAAKLHRLLKPYRMANHDHRQR